MLDENMKSMIESVIKQYQAAHDENNKKEAQSASEVKYAPLSPETKKYIIQQDTLIEKYKGMCELYKERNHELSRKIQQKDDTIESYRETLERIAKENDYLKADVHNRELEIKGLKNEIKKLKIEEKPQVTNASNKPKPEYKLWIDGEAIKISEEDFNQMYTEIEKDAANISREINKIFKFDF